MNLFVSVGLMVVFIALSAFFSGTESAYTSLSTAQIASMKSTRGRRGRIVADLAARSDRLLATVLIGNNLMNVAASALATSVTIDLFGNAAIGVMTGVLTLVMLVFAEVTPKQIAIAHNEAISLATARTIDLLARLFRPLVVAIGFVSRGIARLTGGSSNRTATLNELLQMVRHAETVGLVQGHIGRVVKNAVRFGETNVDAVMTHRTRVFSVERRTSIADARRAMAESGHSRAPVYDDDPERIVGVLLIRDLVRTADDDAPVATLMLEPFFVPEHRRVDQVLSELLRARLNLAIVLDEFGGLAGIVTVEDILEEIVGEIYDEHEQRGGARVERLAGGGLRLHGELPIGALGDYMDEPLQIGASDAATVSGYVTEVLGRIPHAGESVATPVGTFLVERVADNRIETLRFARTRSPFDA